VPHDVRCCVLGRVFEFNHKIMINVVARVRLRGEYSTSNLKYIYLANMGRQEILVFY
jgi:hypothetical protein